MRIGRLPTNELVVVRDGTCYDASPALSVLAPQTWPYPKGDQLIANLDAVVAAIQAAPEVRAVGPTDAVSFSSPVANPTKVVGAPVNYESHVDEAQSNLAAFPHAVARIQQAGLFLKAASSLVGPGDGIALRFPDRRTDHELELGVVIGRTADRVPIASALDYVAGYAIA
jgi:2,4-diketo-3-deoxy-L-fuconate hydrolase